MQSASRCRGRRFCRSDGSTLCKLQALPNIPCRTRVRYFSLARSLCRRFPIPLSFAVNLETRKSPQWPEMLLVHSWPKAASVTTMSPRAPTRDACLQPHVSAARWLAGCWSRGPFRNVADPQRGNAPPPNEEPLVPAASPTHPPNPHSKLPNSGCVRITDRWSRSLGRSAGLPPPESDLSRSTCRLLPTSAPRESRLVLCVISSGMLLEACLVCVSLRDERANERASN